jgi:Erv1 / Alr family
MDPRVWGRAFWSTLHHVALGYPAASPTPAQVEAYRAFYLGVGKVLPCAACQVNYERHLAEFPIDGGPLEGRSALFAWTVALHNAVNREQGKPEWTVQQSLDYYGAGGGLRGLWPLGCAEARRNAQVLLGVNVVLAVAFLCAVVVAWRQRRH